ncbi:MAG: hypothetical protein ACJ8F7_14045, partial [Gemmataceae bacterium]
VPRDPAELPPPSWVGRILFRQIVALYARKDRGPERGAASRSRLALFRAALGFARGTGRVPPVNAMISGISFEQIEQPAGPLPDDFELTLERYFLTKVHSLQFAGPTNFNQTFWNGLESLALSYPIALWLARSFSQMPRADALVRGLRTADDSFGLQPLLGSGRQKFGQRILSIRDEIPRLVAWYSR